MFEYQLLPSPTAAKKVKGVKTVEGRFAHALTVVLNDQASQGWEFVTQESFTFEEKGGMMSKSKASSSSFLVFRREVAGDSVPLDLKLEKMMEKRSASLVQPTPETVSAPAPNTGEEPTKISPALSATGYDGTDAPEFGPASKD